MRCIFCNSLVWPFNFDGCSVGIWPGAGDDGDTGVAVPELVISSARGEAMVIMRYESVENSLIVNSITQ